MVTGKTKVIGLIADPIEHSISPILHNEFSCHLNQDYIYVPFKVSSDNLETAVHAMKAMNIKGFNVTVPHKVDVIKYLDYVDETADVIGSVNTVSIENGKLIGYNTDAQGFMDSLSVRDIDLSCESACVIGAGGAARAIVYALIKMNCSSIDIFNRNEEKAQRLSNYMNNKFQTSKCASFNLNELSESSIRKRYRIIINATPVGMYPNIAALPFNEEILADSSQVFYDLIYNPEQTEFLKFGLSKGAATVNGLDMLIYQAAYAYKIWTGEIPDQNIIEHIKKSAIADLK